MASVAGTGCVDDAAYVAAATQQAAATRNMGYTEIAIMVALALWQRNTSKDIAGMQQEIADEQMKLAEKLHDHAKQFWQEELDLLNDAFGEGRAATDYAGLPAGWKTIVQDAMSTGRAEWLSLANTYCFAPDMCEDARWQRNAVLAESDVLSFGARQAEGRAQVMRDRRYERQYAVLKIGRDQLGFVRGFQNVAAAVGERAAGALFGTINSATRAVGYWMQYREPSPWQNRAAISQGGPTLQGEYRRPEQQAVNIITGSVATPSFNPASAQTSKANEVAQGIAQASKPYDQQLREAEAQGREANRLSIQGIREGGLGRSPF